MHITCQRCSTTFDLDERLIKPTGSKVRCSQCRHVFLAGPAAAEPVSQPPADGPGEAASALIGAAAPMPTGAAPAHESEEGIGLEGIDLAELDAMLESDAESFLYDTADERSPGPPVEDTAGLDDLDLDLDFDMELEPAGEAEAPGAGPETDFDPGMDLDLDAGGLFEAEPSDDADRAAFIAEPARPVDEAAADAMAIEKDLDLSLGGLDLDEPDAVVSAGVEGARAVEDQDLEDLTLADDLDDARPVFDEADIIDEDLELKIDALDGLDVAEPGGAEPADDTLTQKAGSGLELEDFDFLDDELTPSEETPKKITALKEEEEPELVLADLDFELDAEDKIDLADAVDSQVPDALELQALDGLVQEAPRPAGAASAPVEQEPELILDDFDSPEPEADRVAAQVDATSADLDELDLGELVLDDLEMESAAVGSSKVEDSEEDGLDIALGVLELDEEDMAVSSGSFSEDAGEESEELSLSLEDDDFPVLETISADAPKTGKTQAPELSELDGLLENGIDFNLDEEASGADAEPGLELDLEPETAEAGKIAETKDLDDLEELEFELDAEFDQKPVAKDDRKPIDAEDQEIDLTDIEQMLEENTLIDVSATAKMVDIPEETARGGDLLDASDGLDLADFEKAIDDVETETFDLEAPVDEELSLDTDGGKVDLTPVKPAAKQETGLEDLRLDLDLDLDLDDVKRPAAGNGGDLDLVLASKEKEKQDLSDFEDLELELEMEDEQTTIPAASKEDEEALDLSGIDLFDEGEKPAVKTETVDAGDIELEFEIEDDQATVEDAAATDLNVDETIAAASAAPLSKKPPMGSKPVKGPMKKKKGSNKWLIILLILALLGLGAYFGYNYIVQHNIKIPYLSEYINPEPQDPFGREKMTRFDLNSKFVDNEQAGRLFVITGKIRNGYSTVRGLVQLRGMLYGPGKVLVKNENAYAGVVLSDEDLNTKPLAEIREKLNKIPNPQNASTKVNPGQALPFMVVFSDLPADLKEYGIDVVRSQIVP